MRPFRLLLTGVFCVAQFAHGSEFNQRLVNLSTRAQVGTGANVMITGFVIEAGASKQILIRAIGPQLGGNPFNISGTLTDPVLSVYTQSGSLITSNDNWSAADAATFSSVGAFALNSNSRDAALVTTLSPGVYTAQVTGAGGGTGIALVEVYDVTGAPKLLNLSTRALVGTGVNTLISGLVVGPGTNRRVLVRAAGPGLASLGVPGTIADPILSVVDSTGQTIVSNDNWETNNSGGDLAAAFTQGGAFAYQAGSRDAALVTDLAPGAYTVQVSSVTGTTGLALVEVYDLTSDATAASGLGGLFSSMLRTATASVVSTAYGTATIQLNATEVSAIVNVSFANLSSPEVVAHLAIDGNYIVTIPSGQVSNFFWFITPTISYSVADIVAALKAGRVYLSIDSSTYPTGELTGTFLRTSGSITFTPPTAQSITLGVPTRAEAARFLSQATFGPTIAEIDALVQKGYAAWLDEQMALPATSLRAAILADFIQFTIPTIPAGTVGTPSATNRQAAWWKIAVTGPDQLRQRVAFALSELFVVSDTGGTFIDAQEGMANYYDHFVNRAFGNFRTLLEDVTLSPIMGQYLSALRNGKGTFDAQGRVLTSADENYAREVMQLFTVGLQKLQPDGTLQLDSNGQPIPSYDQTTISETAKVFTGWGYFSTATNPSFRSSPADYINRMMLYPAQHDTTQKIIIGGRVLAANRTGTQDLADTLDALFNHQNTAPFVSRQLIQRLVTSNPSPGYVYRVAAVFANNGSGVRGDLGAVVRAILTDYEARSGTLLNITSYGKLKEPVIRLTALLRAFDGGSNVGRFSIQNTENSLLQAPLRAPTVFNFFEPFYVQQGPLAAAGLYTPEFQILNDSSAVTAPNTYHGYIYANRSATDSAQQTIGLVLTQYTTIVRSNPGQVVDQLNLLLCSGTLPQAGRDRIVTALNALAATVTDLERVRIAIYLVVTTQEGAVQK